MPNDVYVKLQTVVENIVSLTTCDSAEEIEKAVKSARYKEDQWIGGIFDAIVSLREIPAADVEPKREIAPWKVAGAFDDFYQCTKCGNMWPIFSTVEWAYCPVCGFRKFPEPPKEEVKDFPPYLDYPIKPKEKDDEGC